MIKIRRTRHLCRMCGNSGPGLGCEWCSGGIPVTGWTATRDEKYHTYRVEYCPKYRGVYREVTLEELWKVLRIRSETKKCEITLKELKELAESIGIEVKYTYDNEEDTPRYYYREK